MHDNIFIFIFLSKIKGKNILNMLFIFHFNLFFKKKNILPIYTELRDIPLCFISQSETFSPIFISFGRTKHTLRLVSYNFLSTLSMAKQRIMHARRGWEKGRKGTANKNMLALLGYTELRDLLLMRFVR